MPKPATYPAHALNFYSVLFGLDKTETRQKLDQLPPALPVPVQKFLTQFSSTQPITPQLFEQVTDYFISLSETPPFNQSPINKNANLVHTLAWATRLFACYKAPLNFNDAKTLIRQALFAYQTPTYQQSTLTGIQQAIFNNMDVQDTLAILGRPHLALCCQDFIKSHESVFTNDYSDPVQRLLLNKFVLQMQAISQFFARIHATSHYNKPLKSDRKRQVYRSHRPHP